MNYSSLIPPTVKSLVAKWIEEDLPGMDIGGFVVGDKPEVATRPFLNRPGTSQCKGIVAHLLCKSPCVLAGAPFAQAVFDYFSLQVTWHFADGAELDGSSSDKIVTAVVSGPARQVLMAERSALNILSRASGVATAAKKACAIAQQHSWAGMVAGTRKTTPGFRSVEKYALVVGGSATHRTDLSQMVMIKDNHIWSAGSITVAVERAKVAAGFTHKVEVECQSLEEAEEACEAGADIVMLDNFAPADLHRAASAVKAAYPHAVVEASGGITEATMGLFMGPDVDVISRGNLTQGYPCMDFSLKIQK